MTTRFRNSTYATLIAIASLLGASSTASANDKFLVFNTIALHFENFDERNTFTPGVGFEYSPSQKIGWHIGTVSDSFGYQSTYGGLNIASKRSFGGKVRFMLAATILHKQFRVNAEPETKLVPLPAMEYRMTKNSVLNISGSPEIDFGDHSNNAVVFFQLKLNMR
jgi:hypothetical protein